MSVSTFTKTGTKATTAAKLNKDIFGIEIKNHQLLKDAYLAYLAKGRGNNAVVKNRGDVSGGGIKPWKQKGTGRARFGSSRNPLWRKGGSAFGPTGEENYTRKLNVTAKRLALRQALSMAATEGRIKVIEAFDCKDGKVSATATLLKKLEVSKNVLIVVAEKDSLVVRATSNLPKVQAVQARYLNVYDIVNADHIIIDQKSLPIIEEWLGESK